MLNYSAFVKKHKKFNIVNRICNKKLLQTNRVPTELNIFRYPIKGAILFEHLFWKHCTLNTKQVVLDLSLMQILGFVVIWTFYFDFNILVIYLKFVTKIKATSQRLYLKTKQEFLLDFTPFLWTTLLFGGTVQVFGWRIDEEDHWLLSHPDTVAGECQKDGNEIEYKFVYFV